MATTKTTTRSRTSKKTDTADSSSVTATGATTTKATADKTTSLVRELQAEVASLRNEVTALKSQITSKVAASNASGGDVEELERKIVGALKTAGIKHWVLMDHGLL